MAELNPNNVLNPSDYKILKAEGRATMHKVDAEYIQIYLKKYNQETGQAVFEQLPQPVKVSELEAVKVSMLAQVDDMTLMIDEAVALVEA